MTRYTPLWLQAGSYPAGVDRRLIGALWPGPAVTGCAVTVGSGMTVNVAPGTVAAPSQNGTGSTLCTSDAVENVTLASAPASGQNRIDLVVCQPRGNDLDGGSNTDFIFAAVTGTAAATPTTPAVPAGAVALAQIYVPGGSASVTAGNITDLRSGLGLQPGAVPYCHVRQTNAQSIPASAWTIIQYDTVEAGVGWDVTNRRYVVPLAGRYLVTAAIGVAGAATVLGVSVVKNGGETNRGVDTNVNGAPAAQASMTATVRGVVGDLLQIQAYVTPALPTNPSGTFIMWAHFDYLGP